MPSERPNILLLLVDSARPEVYGAYGGACRTPHLDRLASEGVRFDRVFCASPICHPARATVVTGLFPHAHGVLANRCGTGAYPYSIFDGLPTIPRLLSGSGYRCGYAGQRHIDCTGFHDDRAIPTVRFHEQLRARGLAEEPLPDRKFTACGRLPYDIELTREAGFARAAVSLLRNYADLEVPWFIQCDFDGPHPPCLIPHPYDMLHDPASIPLPENIRDPLSDKPPVHLACRAAQGSGAWTDDTWRVLLAHYYGMITMLDDLIGRILGELETLGMAEDTAVLFSSDHGGFVGGHGLLYHGTPLLFEEGLRVPLVARWPRGWRPGVQDQLVSHVDLLPTVAGLAGVAPPGKCHGESLLPLLSGRGVASWRDDVYGAYNGDGVLGYTTRAIRTSDWKYVFHPFAGDELYDLRSDPGETRNRTSDPASARSLEAMRGRLDARMAEMEDPVRRSALWKTRRSR